jgi:hypothetical protein
MPRGSPFVPRECFRGNQRLSRSYGWLNRELPALKKPHACHWQAAAKDQILLQPAAGAVLPSGLGVPLASGHGLVRLPCGLHRQIVTGHAFALSPHQTWGVSPEEPLGRASGSPSCCPGHSAAVAVSGRRTVPLHHESLTRATCCQTGRACGRPRSQNGSPAEPARQSRDHRMIFIRYYKYITYD